MMIVSWRKLNCKKCDFPLDNPIIAIRIGFEKKMYNFTEPPVSISKSFPIQLVKEDGRLSEQTFTMRIDVSNMTSPYQPATVDDDFTHQVSDIKIFPDQQFVQWEFELIPNEAPEENEAFRLILSSKERCPKFLTDSPNVYNETLIIINDPQSEPYSLYAYSPYCIN